MDLRFNWGGEGYPTYDGYMKVSGGEKHAANQTANEAQLLGSWMQTQFTEQQNLLNNVLIPQLTQMAVNPQGFGPQALAYMRSQTIGTIGAQLSSQEKGLAQQFASQNMAGLGSGVQAALTASAAQTAAGQEASNLGQIAIANAQAKMQQQQFGLQGLAGAEQALGGVPQSAGLAVQASGTSFNEQYKMAQQGGLLQNILGGIAGAGLGYLTGGPAGAVFGGIKGFAGGSGGGGGGATDSSVLSNLPTWLGGPSAPTSAPFPGFTPGTIGQPVYAPGTDLGSLPPSPLALPPGAFGPGPS